MYLAVVEVAVAVVVAVVIAVVAVAVVAPSTGKYTLLYVKLSAGSKRQREDLVQSGIENAIRRDSC
ncbi:hypothetical protein GMORB2_3183 [Geosmithia morbida]|uniref:Uncharacterized protein n=1 Tax=Geosmithia morbida TaxID=1094350 RepID=A0A9P4YRA6_9HYPO|nr:uncharacterized protein GMORB2_3183 [Geosmithia morbida]KAF4120382.1 hypothetical protein GMORB2_3183 [Geosmithia morbida]